MDFFLTPTPLFQRVKSRVPGVLFIMMEVDFITPKFETLNLFQGIINRAGQFTLTLMEIRHFCSSQKVHGFGNRQ